MDKADKQVKYGLIAFAVVEFIVLLCTIYYKYFRP